MSSGFKIGFLGAGKMATALAKGFIRTGLVAAENVMAGDLSPAAREAFAKETGANVTASNADVARFAQTLVLAVKPAHVDEALSQIRAFFTDQHLLITIAAGVSIKTVTDALFETARVIRVMPNTPALVGASATGYAPGGSATKEDAALAQKLFSSVGIAFELKESLLDAVTGLSGSGPAYAYMMIEALSDGGVAAGLPRDIATRLAAQTLLGSARMVLETGIHPGALKDMVTSPGGTTIEGVYELELAGVRGALMTAVRSAAEKSQKLGRK
jgi:pyrroline-5-carboxylate reductase